MIKRCKNSKCKSEYQDYKYGKKMRVQNPTEKSNHRCTVCKTEN